MVTVTERRTPQAERFDRRLLPPMMVSALYLATAIGQPLIGRFVDSCGARRTFLIGAALTLTAGVVGVLSPTGRSPRSAARRTRAAGLSGDGSVRHSPRLAPITTVRSGGRWNTSVRLAALCAIQTNSRSCQPVIRGAPLACRVSTDRK